MRTWIGGACLTAATCGGLFFVLSGAGHPSHCGPCLAGTCPAPAKKAATIAPTITDLPPVVDVVAVTPIELLPPPRPLPFVSFDEPPLAPTVDADGQVIQAGFVAPDAIPPAADVELAPAPRKVAAPFRHATPDDPF